jgi:glutaredoxin
MKQQCHVAFVYLSWAVLLGGPLVQVALGQYVQAVFWLVFVGLFLWLYVRYFPAFSRSMGYGSVADEAANGQERVPTAQVVLYTGKGCPFCPLVQKRLTDLQKTMGFQLKEVDITFRPEIMIAKGIRALPVVEIGDRRLVGNATSAVFAKFIAGEPVTVTL